MKKHLSTILIVLIFAVGVGLIGYPSFSNWWNTRGQKQIIDTYETAVSEIDADNSEAMLAAADAYNAQLLTDYQNGLVSMGQLTDEQTETYNQVLDVTGTGVMGVVRIPKIDVELPIYHGTDDGVLQIAVGHLEGSSLPVGGTGTHAVLSGHRGLPSAELFTNIDALGIGDVFIITCMDRKITYEVDQIVTVLPNELDELAIDPDQDYCTLVTCTPYGINSHRLLVRGHRIENLLDDQIETIQVEIPERELSTQERLQQYLPYAMILAAGFFVLALILPSKKKDSRDDRDDRRDRRRRDRRDRDDRREETYYDEEDSTEYYDDDDEYEGVDFYDNIEMSHYGARGGDYDRCDDYAAREDEE